MPSNVLFLCTGNSARSILAEALVNHMPESAPRLRAYSAGSHPKGEVHPLALELLAREGIPIEGLRSKGWDEFGAPDAPLLDFIVTVCDHAAGEQCPIWPGHPVRMHWSLPDPAAVSGSDEQKRKAFADTYVELKRRIKEFTASGLNARE